VRASLDAHEPPPADEENKLAQKSAAANMPSYNPGKVILIVPDMSMVDYFRDQVCHLVVNSQNHAQLQVRN
jgi:hypothetical protein